jgi:hypothetical protein
VNEYGQLDQADGGSADLAPGDGTDGADGHHNGYIPTGERPTELIPRPSEPATWMVGPGYHDDQPTVIRARVAVPGALATPPPGFTGTHFPPGEPHDGLTSAYYQQFGSDLTDADLIDSTYREDDDALMDYRPVPADQFGVAQWSPSTELTDHADASVDFRPSYDQELEELDPSGNGSSFSGFSPLNGRVDPAYLKEFQVDDEDDEAPPQLPGDPPNLHDLGEPMADRSAESDNDAYERSRYLDDFEPETLPQRVPSEPDVPPVIDPQGAALAGSVLEQDALAGEASPLARIASYLRHERDTAAAAEREDEFNANAVMAAVRNIPGVDDAVLRTSPGGVHTLRLELADGADAGQVSRAVARLINERLGLHAEQTGGFFDAGPALDPMPDPEPADQNPYTRLDDDDDEPERLASIGGRGLGLVGGPDERTRRRHAMAALRGRATPAETRINPGEARSGQARAAIRQVLASGQVEGPISRVIVDEVQLTTLGVDATVEVRLVAGTRRTVGVASGPAVDGYMVRLAAVAAAAAIDELLADAADAAGRARCFVEHAGIISFGATEVAIVVLWISENTQFGIPGRDSPHIDQLAGSAVVGGGDPRQAVVRATLAAVNRKLEALLP